MDVDTERREKQRDEGAKRQRQRQRQREQGAGGVLLSASIVRAQHAADTAGVVAECRNTTNPFFRISSAQPLWYPLLGHNHMANAPGESCGEERGGGLQAALPSRLHMYISHLTRTHHLCLSIRGLQGLLATQQM